MANPTPEGADSIVPPPGEESHPDDGPIPLTASTAFAISLLWLLHWLPFRVLTFFGYLLGTLLYIVPTSRRKVGEINLGLCLPDLPVVERNKIVRDHFRYLACMFLEYGYLWFSSQERIKKLVKVEGLEHLKALENRPVIFSIPHFTGLDLAGTRISLETPVVSIYSKQKNPALDRLVRSKRLRFDTAVILSRQDGVRPTIKYLKAGYRFFYLPDQDFGPRESIFVPFFGVPAATIPALSRLARIADAAVLPCYIRRERDGYTMVIEPPLQDFPTRDQAADTERMNHVIEAQILRQPGQYFWLHKRFKTRPPGEARFYK
jgi:KDO2-lipid IV(A) lauroyltransferase